jgi:hypothetical protein
LLSVGLGWRSGGFIASRCDAPNAGKFQQERSTGGRKRDRCDRHGAERQRDPDRVGDPVLDK